MSAAAFGQKGDHSEVWVQMNSLVNDLRWIWPKNKFINRKYLMAEMYENYESSQGEEDWQWPDVGTQTHLRSKVKCFLRKEIPSQKAQMLKFLLEVPVSI